MITDKETISLSKFLSLVLRHQPEVIGIKLDEFGWVGVDHLIKQMTAHGKVITPEILNHVVETNTKKRFAYNAAGDQIRANQGHSLKIDLDLQPQVPPVVLYHGTGSQSVDDILKTGLEKRSRQHVHLSSEIQTAISVGQRHGKPVVLVVEALTMHQNSHDFFLSANGVWLTEAVPPKYLYPL